MNKKAILILLFSLGLLLVPFFFIALYIHPSADDFGSTHLIKHFGIWKFQQFAYMNWMGRYFNNFVSSINPLYYDSFFGYKLLAVVLLALFIISLYIFIRSISVKLLNKTDQITISLLLTVVYLNIIPNPSETIYWMSGSLCYFLPTILTLLFLAFIVKAETNIYKRKSNIVITSILAFCIIGCNEINLLFVIEITILLYFKKIIKNKNGTHKYLTPLLIVILLFSLIEVLAPGNYVRMTNYNDTTILYGLLESIKSVFKLFLIHFKNSVFIITSIISLPLISKLIKNSFFFSSINPWIASFIAFAMLICAFFPVCYATGMPPPLRIYNTTSMFFIIAWFGIISIFLKYYSINIEIPKYFKILLYCSFFIFIVTDFSKIPGKSICIKGNVLKAAYDLIFIAPTFNAEMLNRYKQIKNEKYSGKTIEVPEITAIPTSIYFIDIGKDETSWINLGTSQYFKIQGIRLKKSKVKF